MVDRISIQQIFGSLMKHPQFLSETDRYQLTPDDFYYRLDKFIFAALDNLYQSGAQRIQPIDIENAISLNKTAITLFNQQNGLSYLQDAEELCEENNFPYYYKRLKKFNLLNAFEAKGIDIKDFYIEDPLVSNADEINAKFDQLEISDIVNRIKAKLLGVEREFVQNDTTEVENVAYGIEDLIEGCKEHDDIGLPVQGEIFNEVISGARKGVFVLRSASSGTGKTRNAVGDACYLAFPYRYEDGQGWVKTGSNRPVLFIATEQNFNEIQKMILSYLTGFSESKFRYGQLTLDEQRILKQALWVINQYQNNFFIVRMPNPTIELVKTIVRENVLLHDIEYVFYDYIFICPSLLNEFKGFNLRNDEILLMFSTALKDLAVELGIFMMSSTQVNAKADDNKDIRNEASISGSRSIINKADIGCVMARPTKEELEFFAQNGDLGIPNIVTDIYKVRSGEWNQVRIWSDANLGNLRKKDLFVTDSRLEILTGVGGMYKIEFFNDPEEEAQLAEELKYVNEMSLYDD